MTVTVAALDASFEERQTSTFVCDGTEDASEIMAALAALPPEGGVLRLSAGTFDLGEDNVRLNGRNDITIEGAGIDATVITNRTDRPYDSEPLSYTRCDRAIVRGLTISAGGSERHSADALDFDDCSDCLIEQVRVTNSRSRGIVFDGKDEGAEARGNIIRDCVVTGCPGAAGIQLLVAQECEVINCSSIGNRGHGLMLHRHLPTGQRSSHNRIVGGTYAENGATGIYINEGDDNVIDGVRCLDNFDDGIRVVTKDDSALTAHRTQIRNCTCTNTNDFHAQGFGVTLNADDPGEIRDTVLLDNDLRGNRVGPYRSNAVDTLMNGNQIDSFVRTMLVLSKSKARYDGRVVASISGFGQSTTVELRWPDGKVLSSGMTNGNGFAELVFRIPNTPYGTYLVRAVDSGDHFASTRIRVIPRLVLSQTVGTAATRVEATLYGFTEGDQVLLQWLDLTSSTEIDTLGSLLVGSQGWAATPLTIPRDAPDGRFEIRANVVGINRSASSRFTVTRDAS